MRTRHQGGAAERGVTGTKGAEIDHIELFWHAGVLGGQQPQLRSLPRQCLRSLTLRNGTSAKMACLYVMGTVAGRDVATEGILGIFLMQSICS
jgi:hypothetical protein